MESYTDVVRLVLVPKSVYLYRLSLMKGTVFQMDTKLDDICKWSEGKGHWRANYPIIWKPEARKQQSTTNRSIQYSFICLGTLTLEKPSEAELNYMNQVWSVENKQCRKEESVYRINYMLPLVISQEVQTTEKMYLMKNQRVLHINYYFLLWYF